jgi:hypothetical protein
MTPQQQTIALYEAMGWRHYYEGFWIPPQQTGDPDDLLQCTGLPLIDHNFLALCREKLLVTDEEKCKFIIYLEATILRRTPFLTIEFYALLNASPTQQITALLKAAGLWKE